MSAYRSGVTLHLEDADQYGRLCLLLATAESMALSLALASVARLLRRSAPGKDDFARLARTIEDPGALTSVYATSYTPSLGILLGTLSWVLSCRYSTRNLAVVLLLATAATTLHGLVTASIVSSIVNFLWSTDDDDEEEEPLPVQPQRERYSNRHRRD